MTAWASYLEENKTRFRDDLLEFLRIPSISSLPEHADDVQRAAQWAADRLTAAGLEHARVLPTARHPVVYADWLHAPGKPTILIYGHVDVQPVDPLDLWTSPPFEPLVEDDRVYARGACDMKSGVVHPIASIEAMLKTAGELPVNVKFFLEGEEEIGSPSIPPFLEANRELFACDLVLSADGGQRAEDKPILIVGFRGLAGVQIDVRSANTDLHSGTGGMAPNSINALVALLASMRSADGRVLVRGFYDDVRLLSDADRAAIAAVGVDEDTFLKLTGVTELVGEPGFTPAERVAARPTLEINGIWGGFQGEGTKTVIPAEAHAKITCRLVPDQNPDRIVELLAEHVAAHTPRGVRVTVIPQPGRSRAYLMPTDHAGNEVAATVLGELYDAAPDFVRGGGTLPVSSLFKEILGADFVTLGFNLPDTRGHAPNEFCRFSGFEQGQRAYCRFLEEAGKRRPDEFREVR